LARAASEAKAAQAGSRCIANKMARIAWKLMLTAESYNAKSTTLVAEV
jgi:hypothetical protein